MLDLAPGSCLLLQHNQLILANTTYEEPDVITVVGFSEDWSLPAHTAERVLLGGRNLVTPGYSAMEGGRAGNRVWERVKME